PSGLNAECTTLLLCWSGELRGSAVRESQARAVKSALTVRTRLPSELNEAYRTSLLCRIGGTTGVPVTESQIRAVQSPLAVRKRRPSGLNCTAVILSLYSNTDHFMLFVTRFHTVARPCVVVSTREPSGS